MNKRLFSLICAVSCSFIWGTGFIAQDMGMDHIGPFTFSGGRLLLGFITLVPFFFVYEYKSVKKSKITFKNFFYYMFFLAFFLSFGNVLQQFSLLYTDVANTAMYTVLYVVIVPFIAFFYFSKKIHWSIWPSVLICLTGGMLLTEINNVSVRFGDGLAFINAFFGPSILF